MASTDRIALGDLLPGSVNAGNLDQYLQRLPATPQGAVVAIDTDTPLRPAPARGRTSSCSAARSNR